MKQSLVFLLLFAINYCASAQVVNSMSSDKTGMYFYSLDTLVTLLKVEKKIERLIVRADWQIIRDFPDTIQQIKILKEEGKETKIKKITSADVVVKITGLSIILDEISLSMQTLERQGKQLQFFAGVVYIFHFQYQPDTKTYLLTRIQSSR